MGAVGHTYRIWLHAWRLRARTVLPPVWAAGKAAKRVLPGEGDPFAIDVAAPAPEWAQDGFDAQAWLGETVLSKPRPYPFVWAANAAAAAVEASVTAEATVATEGENSL